MALLPSPVPTPRRSAWRKLSLAVGAIATVWVALAAPVARAQDVPPVPYIPDTEIEETIKAETAPVLAACGVDPRQVHFYLVPDKDLNAFTAGGTAIFINTGLIQETQVPNQLIGVVAHECGHISGGHAARSDEMMHAGLKPMLLTMGLGILAAAAGAPDAGAALLMSSGYFGTLSVLKYSRVQEASADQAAATSLEKAGLSGKGLVEFFDNFRYQEVFADARRYKYFQSHPLTGDRIEALRRRVEVGKHYNDVDSPEAIARHDIMKAKLDAYMDPPQQTFMKYKETDTSFKARYARAIAYEQAKELDKSMQLIDALLADYPTNPYVWEVKGQIYFESGRPVQAEAANRRSVELKPDGPLLKINLAQSILAEERQGGPEEAVLLLKSALSEDKEEPLAWRLLGEAYDAKHMGGQARLAIAEYHYSLGDYNGAKAFAMRARELLPQNTPDWRRATDIVLVSKPSNNDLKALAQGGDQGG
jgi:predicted Zn-dependent protease